MVPRYPNRLSANRGEASSLRHSICPKCVRSPNVKRYNSLATLFRLWVYEYVFCDIHYGGCACIPHIGIVAFLPETGSYSSALFLYDSSLVGNCLCGAHISNELFDYGSNMSALTTESGHPAYENSCSRSRGPQNGA